MLSTQSAFKVLIPTIPVWFPCQDIMSTSCGAGFICLQYVLLKVEDKQERAFIHEVVDIGGCPLQSCQTYSLVYVWIHRLSQQTPFTVTLMCYFQQLLLNNIFEKQHFDTTLLFLPICAG